MSKVFATLSFVIKGVKIAEKTRKNQFPFILSPCLITILSSENSSPFCQFFDGCYCTNCDVLKNEGEFSLPFFCEEKKKPTRRVDASKPYVIRQEQDFYLHTAASDQTERPTDAQIF